MKELEGLYLKDSAMVSNLRNKQVWGEASFMAGRVLAVVAAIETPRGVMLIGSDQVSSVDVNMAFDYEGLSYQGMSAKINIASVMRMSINAECYSLRIQDVVPTAEQRPSGLYLPGIGFKELEG